MLAVDQFSRRLRAARAALAAQLVGLPGQSECTQYAALLLYRLMVTLLLQGRGWLAGDFDYLRTRLAQYAATEPACSFFRGLLLPLFHEALAQPARRCEQAALLGTVPALGLGLFAPHPLERQYPLLDVPDPAIQQLLDELHGFVWRLDDGPPTGPDQVTPDTLGALFEQDLDNKQLGAYYTQADVTGYIARSCLIPALFDLVEQRAPGLFAPGGLAWAPLWQQPDRYIQPALRHGVDLPLPAAVAAGLADPTRRALWNQPAAAAYGLANETWREQIARRARCHELRALLAAGALQSVDDCVTHNLDVAQLAQDLIARCESPALLMAWYTALAGMTVLDPTCGAGAFLLAALAVLEPLYAACLTRMAALAATAVPGAAGVAELRALLDAAARSPSWDYYIRHSIVLNNLYGVDLMPEAVELCRLRLCLKLVAPVAQVAQVEPLPELALHLRAGNALVGFASEAAVYEAVARRDAVGPVAQVLAADQPERLCDELDALLARDTGVAPEAGAALAGWRASHQPLHWWVVFPAVLRGGGFDVVIGNPPYLPLSKVRQRYAVHGYRTAACGNLYALVIERALALLRSGGRCGMIVPIASISTTGMAELQALYHGLRQWHSHYAVRPGKLFAGVDMNLTISLLCAAGGAGHTTGYRRWYSGPQGERRHLFSTLAYTPVPDFARHVNRFPKLGSPLEAGLLGRMLGHGRRLRDYLDPCGATLHVHSGGRYWRKAMPLRLSSHYKPLTVATEVAAVVFGLLNSQLFYWYWICNSNCMDVVAREVLDLPVFDLRRAEPAGFAVLMEQLLAAYAAHSHTRLRQGERIALAELNVDVAGAKPVIDAIDVLLAQHYGLSAAELDFVLNYDIKYRLGRLEACELGG